MDEAFYEELTDALILSDMGAAGAQEAVEKLRRRAEAENVKETARCREMLKEILVSMLDVPKTPLKWPMVILMVGVNGVGKTTTIGKLAFSRWAAPFFCARRTPSARRRRISWRSGRNAPGCRWCATRRGPTRRAWCSTRCRPPGPARPTDDSGYGPGRCTKKNLMDEMEKMRRVIVREYPRRRWLPVVVDETTARTASAGASVQRAAGINGVVLTAGGTAKGEVLILHRAGTARAGVSWAWSEGERFCGFRRGDFVSRCR